MNRKLLQQRAVLFLLTIAALTPSIVKPMKRSMNTTERAEDSKRQKVTTEPLSFTDLPPIIQKKIIAESSNEKALKAVNKELKKIVEAFLFTYLPIEMQEKVIAASSNKGNIRTTSTKLKTLASKNNPHIILENPLHLTEKAYQFQLMRALLTNKTNTLHSLTSHYAFTEQYLNATYNTILASKSMNELTTAAFNDDIKGVKEFIMMGQYHAPDNFNHDLAVLLTPTFIATNFGYMDLLQYFAKEYHLLLAETTADNYSLLHIAAQSESPEITQFLLDLNNDENTYFAINAETSDGLTPIMLATSHNKIENIKLLLRYGASLENYEDGESSEDDSNEEEESDSSIDNSKEIYSDKPIHVNKTEAIQYYPDFYAVSTGNLELLQYIQDIQDKLPQKKRIKGGINGKTTLGGWSLLHVAAENNYPEITKFLIDKDKIDINSYNLNESMTPLHIAAMHNNIENMQLLLAAKATPFEINNKKESIMGTAILNGCTDAVKLLLPYYKSAQNYKSAQKEKLWLPFATKEHAIEYAQEKGFEEIATMLNE